MTDNTEMFIILKDQPPLTLSKKGLERKVYILQDAMESIKVESDYGQASETFAQDCCKRINEILSEL